MMNAIKSLKRMKTMAFLIVLQFAVGLMLLNSSTMVIENTRGRLNIFNKMFDYDKTLVLRCKPKGTEKLLPPDKIDEGLKKIYEELEKLKSEGVINKNKIYFTYFPKIKGLKDLVKDEYRNYEGEVISDYAATLMVNYDFISGYDLEIDEGRGFIEEDFKLDYRKENIPIIIGKDYKEKTKIGDVFKENVVAGYEGEGENFKVISKDINYEIVGYYDNNAIPTIFSKTSFIERIRLTDSFMILPTVKDSQYDNEIIALDDLGCFVELGNINNLKYIEERIKPILEEYELISTVQYIKDEYTSVKEVLLRDVINSVVLGGILTFLSIIGLMSVLIGEIRDRKKEFGIRLSYGATTMDICKELIIEVLLMLSISSVLSLGGMFLKNPLTVLNIRIIVYNIIFILILSLLIGIIPIVKLRKANVIELMRGE